MCTVNGMTFLAPTCIFLCRISTKWYQCGEGRAFGTDVHGTEDLCNVHLHCSLCLRKNHSIDRLEHLSAASMLCKPMQQIANHCCALQLITD